MDFKALQNITVDALSSDNYPLSSSFKDHVASHLSGGNVYQNVKTLAVHKLLTGKV